MMGDRIRKTKDGQKQVDEDKLLDVNTILGNPPEITEGINNGFAIFSKKGIFGPGGFLAEFDSSEQPSSSTSSPSLKVIKGPSLTHDDKGLYQNCSPKKFKFSTDNQISFNKKEITVKDATGSSNDKIVLLDTNSSSSLEESVLSVDHILESILSELDRQTLLKCRLVARRWAYFGAKALQKIVDIRMDQGYTTAQSGKLPSYHVDRKPRLCLEALIALMNNSTEFPSTTFSFWNSSFGKLKPTIQPFLIPHGACIKKLRFNGWVSLNVVKQLLFTQAPNIQQLLLTDLFAACYTQESKDMDYKCAEEQGSHFDVTTIIRPPSKLQNLKVFKCGCHVPEPFIQDILKWSPNLVEVVVPEDLLHLLVKPVNRLHLLKELHIKIIKYKINALEYVANHHEDNLALERIQFRFFTEIEYDVYPKAVAIIGKLLKGSARTCQKLMWDYFIGIKIPKMPQVKCVTFCCREKDCLPVNVFERWSSLGESFPNLKSLIIIVLQNCKGPFENYFRHRGTARILTVRDVYLSYQPQYVEVEGFKTLFPNATIHPLTGDTDFYSDSLKYFGWRDLK